MRRVIHDVRSYCLEGGEDPGLLDLDIFNGVILLLKSDWITALFLFFVFWVFDNYCLEE